MEELIDESDTPKRRVRRTYTREFKTQLVAECTSGEKSIAQLSIEHRSKHPANNGITASRIIEVVKLFGTSKLSG